MRLPYKSGNVTLTSRFGLRTLDGTTLPHEGIDLVGTDKTIVAPCDGVVGQSTMLDKATDTTRTWEWGNYVRIDTADGLKIYLCHLETRLVKIGDRVKTGDAIGIEGNTGYVYPAPTGPEDKTSGRHLHFEIRKNGASVNPCTYLGIPNEKGKYIVETEEQNMEEKQEVNRIDSEPQEWAEEAVEWAVENGIIYGDGNGNLMLRENCTREQVLVFLYRALKQER